MRRPLAAATLALAVWAGSLGTAAAPVGPPRPEPASSPAPDRLAADLRLVEDLVPAEYRRLVVDTARRWGLEPRLLAAVAWVETGGTWDPHLVGTSGEVGLMQVIPSTAAYIARQRGEPYPDLRQPAIALDYGAWYLARLVDGTGETTLALREYNAGPAWEQRAPTAARSYSRRVEQLTTQQQRGDGDAPGAIPD